MEHLQYGKPRTICVLTPGETKQMFFLPIHSSDTENLLIGTLRRVRRRRRVLERLKDWRNYSGEEGRGEAPSKEDTLGSGSKSAATLRNSRD